MSRKGVVQLDDLNLNPARNEILGELDELNSFVGLAKSFTRGQYENTIFDSLTLVQNHIFLIQAEIASVRGDLSPRRISQDDIYTLEQYTHYAGIDLPELHSFILPAGTTLACALHCVRTIARRVERRFLVGTSERDQGVLSQYFDRLACLVFTLARNTNKWAGVGERQPSYYTNKEEE